MTIFLDEAVEVDVPRTHALVIGVSHYPFADLPAPEPGDAIGPVESFARSVGIESLTSAARSASVFADWLLSDYRNPDAELASLEVLLAPVASEALTDEVRDKVGSSPARATRPNVAGAIKRLRARCQNRPNDVLIVYLAGHGVQLTKRSAVVLLEDFGDPEHVNELEGSIDVESCRRGFDSEGYPNSQFWFVDACRSRPSVLKRFWGESISGALQLSAKPGQVDASVLILASESGSQAFGVVGQTSLLMMALKDGLDGSAAVGPEEGLSDEWWVGTNSLVSHLGSRVSELAEEYEVDQKVDIAGRVRQAVLQRFAEPPRARLTVHGTAPVTNEAVVEVLFDAQSPPVTAGESLPFSCDIPAGLYLVRVDAPADQVGQKLVNLVPPGGTAKLGS